MAKNHTKARENATNKIIQLMIDMDGGNKESFNAKRYKSWLTSMNDTEFTQFMRDLKDHRFKIDGRCAHLTFQINYSKENKKHHLLSDGIAKVAKKWGVDNERYACFPQKNGDEYVPPHKFFYGILPIKLLQQMLHAKNAAASTIDKINILNGQVSGDAAAGSINNTQLQALLVVGSMNVAREFTTLRSDGTTKLAAYTSIEHYGDIALADLNGLSKSRQTNETVDVFLRGAGLNLPVSSRT